MKKIVILTNPDFQSFVDGSHVDPVTGESYYIIGKFPRNEKYRWGNVNITFSKDEFEGLMKHVAVELGWIPVENIPGGLPPTQIVNLPSEPE